MARRRELLSPRQRALRVAITASLIATVAATFAVVVPLFVTSTPEFFSRYHLLERRYVNLSNSAHEGIGCRACHETQPLANGAALIGDFYASLFGAGQTPKYFTFQSPTNEACLACHETDWSDDASSTARIPHPAHQRVADETRQCTGCHKWTAHFEAYMVKHEQMPFSGVCVAYGCHVGTKTTEQCYDCHHVLQSADAAWATQHPRVIQASGKNACMESCHEVQQCQQCHTTGTRPTFNGLPISTDMRDIERLHVRDDWTETNHGTEALKGRDRCLTCHQSEGECGECHLQRPAFHGSTTTWIGRHKNFTDDLDDPRCLECHEPAWCDSCHAQFEEME